MAAASRVEGQGAAAKVAQVETVAGAPATGLEADSARAVGEETAVAGKGRAVAAVVAVAVAAAAPAAMAVGAHPVEAACRDDPQRGTLLRDWRCSTAVAHRAGARCSRHRDRLRTSRRRSG